MKHKLKIWALPPHGPERGPYRRRHPLWYVCCLGCKWEPNTPKKIGPGGPSWFGRATWDEAFALGVEHQERRHVPT